MFLGDISLLFSPSPNSAWINYIKLREDFATRKKLKLCRIVQYDYAQSLYHDVRWMTDAERMTLMHSGVPEQGMICNVPSCNK